MFAYIRWFSIISFVLVLGAAWFVGHSFREIATRDLIAVVGDNNKSLARGFENTTWKDHAQNGMQYRQATQMYHQFRTSGVSPDQWSRYQGYQEMIAALPEFSQRVFKHFEEMSIAEVRIYSTDGAIITSIDPARIKVGNDASGFLNPHPPIAQPNDASFAAALNGEVTSVEEEAAIAQPYGDLKKGVLIKTTVPAMRESLPLVKDKGHTDNKICMDDKDYGCVEGVIEISYDITSQWKRLDLFQLISMLGIISIFVLIIGTLLYTSYKAETIIARQHEANLELAAQAASAQAENRDKSQFLANVSHELRTPLNAIIGFSEFIKSERSGPIGSSKYSEYIRDIHSSGVHLLSLINDILDYSKAEADKLEVDITEVDATKTVKNCIRLVSPRAETAQVNLLEQIPRDHFIIKTDAKKLKQIMLNLLSNAVKFTPSGGAVTVTMWENLVSHALFVEVKDTGIGIAPKDISRAMAPFGQVDNTLSRKYEGTGLGLPLTRKFVEIMGGTFSIQSEEGKGTTVTISLPKELKSKNAEALTPTEKSDDTQEASE